MAQTERLFFGIEQTSILTAHGEFRLPILYHDGSMLGLAYRVEERRALQLLAGLPLEPVTVSGKALVFFGMFDYRQTTIGPYHSMSISILARRRDTSPSLLRFLRDTRGVQDMAWYVTTLPVDSHDSLAAGVEVWGYPKYLAKFSMDFRPGSVRATLAGEFTVTHSQGFGFSARGMPFVTYTIKDRHLIRTFTPVDHRVRYGGSKTVRIEMHGNGPAAQVVQSLGLGSLQPVFTFRTDSLRAVLPQGQDLGAIP